MFAFYLQASSGKDSRGGAGVNGGLASVFSTLRSWCLYGKHIVLCGLMGNTEWLIKNLRSLK